MTDSWRERASCLGSAQPWLWDQTLDDDSRESPAARAERHGLAISICRRCPVRSDCKEEVLALQRQGKPVEGVWFGEVLPSFKVQRHHDRPQPPINHNSESGWNTHKRRGIPVDALDTCGCRRAMLRERHDRARRAVG